MPTGKTKPALKPAKKPARRSKPSARPSKAARPARPKKSPSRKRTSATPKSANKIQPLDLSAFPPESITVLEKWICLACVSDVFTRHLDLAPRTAHLEIKRYTPSIPELYAETTARPWFDHHTAQEPCPYCGSAPTWHTRIFVYRIESGKATDALRRDLVKSLPQSDNQFAVLEEK